MNGKVSVIMAVYNCRNTVIQAIDSIINQTYTNIELIICDDGSTDGTYELVESYAKNHKDKIILIRNQQNSKLPFSLNHCLKYATGMYIARMDGDDISYPDRIQKQVDFLRNNPTFDLVGTAMDVYDGKEIVGKTTRDKIANYHNLFQETPFCHATIMCYKYVYEQLEGYSLKPYVLRNEDLDLWIRFFEKGFKGANIEEALYRVTDDINALRRRKMSYRINTARVLYTGYKKLKFPIYYIIYIILPVLKGLIPLNIYSYLRNKKFK